MNPAVLETSARFLKAAASYFGVPPDQLVMGDLGGAIGGTFTLQLAIALTPDDLAGIATRMKAMDEVKQFDADGLPGTWRTELRDKDGNPWTPKKEEPAQASEGVGGRKVVHVDAPEDGENPMPLAYWIPSDEVTDQQRVMASDSGPYGYLIQEAMLTEEQRAKYLPQEERVDGSELPRAYWIPTAEASEQQRLFASDIRTAGNLPGPLRTEYLIQESMLTDEQRAKYCK